MEAGRGNERGKTMKEVSDEEEEEEEGMKKHPNCFDSLFRAELIFPVGFRFKIYTMIKIVQQCES